MRFSIRTWASFALVLPLAMAACDDDPSDPGVGTPTGVQVTALSPSSVRVTFGAVSGATSYIIERAEGTGAFAEVGTPNTTTFDDTGLTPSTSYRYRVAAVRGSDESPFSSEASVTTQPPGTTVINTDITSNRTLFSDTVYTLTGFIHVANGAVLTIQAGTRIQGEYNALGSSLFIMRGAQIRAMGSADRPIVFTSTRPAGSRQSGDWGGVVLVGNAVINRTGNIQLEGSGSNQTTNPVIFYNGGTNNADDSGELHYVRIEFAGFAPVTDAELNGLTLAAVGSGTEMDHIQVLGGLDDSFEWFGGAADAKYLVSYDSGDDHFDVSEGYVGRLQFLIAYQNRLVVPRPDAGQLGPDPQGIENDGCGSNTGSGCASGYNSTPLNMPVIANFTLVGTGVQTGSGSIGMVLRRGTGGFYVNGVVARWANAGISVRDAQTQQRITDGDFVLNSILIAQSPAIYQTGQQAGVDPAANNLVLSTATAASLFTALPANPANGAALDWSLSTTSPARTGGMTTFSGKLATAAGTFVTGTAYRGAADPSATTKWWEGWTAYATN